MTCGYMLLSTTQVVGLVAPQTYSWIENDAKVYELVKKVNEMKRGERTLAEY